MPESGGGAALGYLQAYGPIVLAITLLLGGLGVPVPASLLVLAAGAFVRQDRFSLPLAFGLALLGAMTGSVGSYLMGRYGLRKIIARMKRSRSWRKAEETFKRRGGTAIVLTRFLLTPLALPTNLIAGGERFPLARFAALSAVGEAIYILIYGGLGFVFAESWKRVGDRVGGMGLWALLGAGVLFGLYELWVHWRGHLTLHPEEIA